MSDFSSRQQSAKLPRLSRTSLFMPVFVSASANPDARRNSDTVDVSPLTSQVRLSYVASQESPVLDEDGGMTPVPAGLNIRKSTHVDEADLLSKDRNDSTSTSATGPAGSGMPPAETAFTCEKEVANGDDQDFLEMPKTRPSFRSTILDMPQTNPLRSFQSPRPRSALEVFSMPGAQPLFDNITNKFLSQTRRSGASFYSDTSLGTLQSRQSMVDDTTDMVLQTAQTAQMKRPSLIQHLGSSSSGQGPFLLTDKQFYQPSKQINNDAFAIGRSHSVAIGDPARERSRWSRIETLPTQIEYETQYDNITPGMTTTNPPNSPEIMDTTEPSDVEASRKKSLTLRDALRMNPFNSLGIPQRSTTVPSSFGMRRKTRLQPLPLDTAQPQSGSFHRESIVATPYPKTDDGNGGYSGRVKNELALEAIGIKPSSLRIAVLRHSKVAIHVLSLVEDAASKDRSNKKDKCNDDEYFIRAVQSEFHGLRGIARGALGAKVAKGANIKLIRVDKADDFHLKDDPLTQDYLGSHAETDLWKLWCNPASGHRRRGWLNLFSQKSKMIDSRWIVAIDVKEGYDATRIIAAFSIVTALCIMAMFFWLFLGVGGEGNTMTFVDGVLLRPTSEMTDVAGRAGDAFLFGILVLFVGWTFIAGWLIASQ